MVNEKYVEEVMDEYGDMVYRIALTRTGNRESAEDIFQDVFVKFAFKNPKFQNSEHEKAWFIRVTINMSKNVINSAWNKKKAELDENIEFQSKDQRDIFETVCNLSQNYKLVIYLFYYEGYKVKEIAEILKVSEGTIKTWLFRAREELKKELGGDFEDE